MSLVLSLLFVGFHRLYVVIRLPICVIVSLNVDLFFS